jgi:hypothetical protein
MAMPTAVNIDAKVNAVFYSVVRCNAVKNRSWQTWQKDEETTRS